jgi:hypothetical protein
MVDVCRYTISVAFTLFNKWMLVYWRGGFPFPVMITMVHMFTKLALTRVLNLCRPADKKFKPLPLSKACRWASVLNPLSSQPE